MEAPLLNAVVIIATSSAVIKFALFEWEGIVYAWSRVSKQSRRARGAGRNRQ
jgi:hypothetical protein